MNARWRLLAFVAAISVALVASPAGADGEIVVTVASVDDSRFPLVEAVFTADESGRPLANLAPSELSITEGGSPATVTALRSASDASMPLALLVTFDTSGSMAGASLAQAKAAASALFRSLSPGDVGGLITFSDGVQVAVPLGGSRAELEAAVQGLQANGNTALYDAVAQSGKLAAGSGLARRAVVLFSDGEDYGGLSGLSRAQSLQAAAGGAALFYVIGIGQQVDRAYLEELARQSGGRYFQAASPSDVPAIYASIEALLRSQYVVTIRSAAPEGARQRTFALTVTRDGRTGTAQAPYLTARPEAAPTPAPAATVPSRSPEVLLTEAPAPAADTGSAPAWPWFALAVALAGAAGYAIWYRRRGTVAPATGGPIAPSPSMPARTPLPRADSHGTITAYRGDSTVRCVAIDGRPLTIGGSPGSGLRLEDPAVDGFEMRLWWRDGSVMAHVLSKRGPEPTINGARFEWASLTEADEVHVGPYRLRFSPDRPGAAK